MAEVAGSGAMAAPSKSPVLLRILRAIRRRCLEPFRHAVRHGGAARIVPSFNEQRVGMACFELEGLAAALTQMGVQADGPTGMPSGQRAQAIGASVARPGIEVTLQAEVGDLNPSRVTLEADDVQRHGLRVHENLLPPGPYRLEARLGDRRWAGSWQVAHRSPRADAWAQACREHGTPLVFSRPCDAADYPYARADLLPWFDRPDALDTVVAWQMQGRIDGPQAAQLRQFVEQGYIEIENAFDPTLIEAAREELLAAARRGHQGFTPGSSQRLEQLHRPPSAIRRLWLNTECRGVIELLFDGPARPVQTLGFVHGSQQDAHQDTIHLTPFPAGYMCGLWIPLEDVQAGSGELSVFPGTHRRPRLRMGDLDCPKVDGQDWTIFGERVVPLWREWAAQSPAVAYRPRRGSALIWHENLLHAGSPRTQADLTRCSLVIHYYAADACAYADSTGEPAMAASVQDMAESAAVAPAGAGDAVAAARSAGAGAGAQASPR